MIGRGEAEVEVRNENWRDLEFGGQENNNSLEIVPEVDNEVEEWRTTAIENIVVEFKCSISMWIISSGRKEVLDLLIEIQSINYKVR